MEIINDELRWSIERVIIINQFGPPSGSILFHITKTKRTSERASERSPLLHHHHHHLGIGSIRAILVPASLSLSTPHLHTLCLYSLRHKTHRHTHLTLLCSLQLLNYGAVVVLLVGNMIEREREKKRRMKERTYCCWLVYRAVTVCRLLPALVAWVELNGRPRATS